MSDAALDIRESVPAFTEPWQAQVFALVECLKNARLIDAGEWSRSLGAKLATLPEHDCGQDAIWTCWVSTLEELMKEHGIAAPLQLASLRQAWQVAAEKTPHGDAIVLGALAYRWAGLVPPQRE